MVNLPINTIITADVMDGLAQLPDNYSDSIVVDPPYELGFMGKEWDRSGIAYSVPMWKEALRVLKPGGHILAFGGTRTSHRMICAIEDAGFEIRDSIMWVYSTGFPKSKNFDNGFGTALKPAHEPICLARKPISEKTLSGNIAKWGTGALNIDGCRIDGEPWTFGSQINMRGGNYNNNRPSEDHIYKTNVESNPLGRWPANFIHDGSDEVVSRFPLSAGQMADVAADIPREGNGIFGAMPATKFRPKRGDTGSAARFFYCPKVSQTDREEGLGNFEAEVFGRSNQAQADIARGNQNDLNSFNKVSFRKNTHPTVKPTPLMQYLCRLVTPPGGIVLDHLCGSGSTLKAAIIEGFNWLGIEKDSNTVKIALARTEYAAKTLVDKQLKMEI